MQVYIKLYFGAGTGNFYALDAEENTLRGLFILQSLNKESKKVKTGYWKTICPISCTVDSNVQFLTAEDLKVSITMNHTCQIYKEVESKYFGKISFFSTQEKKVAFETVEKEKYMEKNYYQVYIKHMGRLLEDTECRIIQSYYDLFYPKVEDVTL